MVGNNIRVLIVEDDQVDQMAYERYFKKEVVPYKYIFADSVKSAKAKLENNHFDIIISDYMLGDGTAIDLFPDFKETPVIIVTGTGDEETAVKAMKLGASDYLIKDPAGFYLKTLPTTVRNAINRRNAEEELKKYRESLEDLVRERTIELEKEIKVRIRAEESLKYEKEFTDRILEALIDTVFVFDSETGRPFRWNKAFTDISGYSNAEITSMIAPDSWYSSEDLKKTERAINEMLRNEKTILEMSLITKDGRRIPTEYTASLIDGIESNVKYIIAVGRDLTERKKNEEALRNAEKKYRTLFELAGDAILIVQYQKNVRKILDCNKRTLGLFGCDRKDLIGKSIADFAPDLQPDGSRSQDKAKQIILEALDGKPQFFEWKHMRKDGTLFDAEVTLTAIDIGEEDCLLSIVRDVTERKKAEEAIRTSEARQSLILRSLPMAFYVAKPYDDYGGTWVSEQIKSISDFSPSDFYENTHLWSERLHPDDYDQTLVAFDNLPEEDELSVEYRWQRADERIIWIEDNAVLVRDDSGKPKEIIGTWLDITDRKRAEEEKEALKNQILQTQKIEALGTLAGGIAHDFNNILSIIIGFVELATMDVGFPEKIQEHLSEVTKASIRAKDLISQILTVSRMKEHEKKPLKVSLIVLEVIKLLQSTIPASIEIRHDIKSHEIVMADSAQIHQIVMNLCTNAYQAMRRSHGILTISLKDIEISYTDFLPGLDINPGKYIRLEVSDTGHGMDDEIKEKIFDPYFTTKEVGEGTGLGLAVVHGIVKSHNGHINVYSEKGIGTTFHIYLPVVNGLAVPLKQTEKIELLIGGKERILIVDDEEKITTITRKGLTKYGYKVKVFNNSYLALQEFEKDPEKYNLLITDMTMPNMNGIELAEKIRALNPDIPVILCSGYSELIDNKKASEMGFYYLMKPILMTELIKTIRSFFDNTD